MQKYRDYKQGAEDFKNFILSIEKDPIFKDKIIKMHENFTNKEDGKIMSVEDEIRPLSERNPEEYNRIMKERKERRDEVFVLEANKKEFKHRLDLNKIEKEKAEQKIAELETESKHYEKQIGIVDTKLEQKKNIKSLFRK